MHYITLAHDKAFEIFADYGLERLVSPVVEGKTNGVKSFLVAWDGSKEGWETSNDADAGRARFVTWLRLQEYEDHSSPYDWVELQYGGDDREVKVIAHDGELELGS